MWLLHLDPQYVLCLLPCDSTCTKWVATVHRASWLQSCDGKQQSNAQDAAVQPSLTCWSISYLSMVLSVGLWSFFNCMAGGPGHVTRSAHPGSTSLYPGRIQAATGIKTGGALRACKAHPLGIHLSCEGTLPSKERDWYLVDQGQDSIFLRQLSSACRSTD